MATGQEYPFQGNDSKLTYNLKKITKKVCIKSKHQIFKK